MNKLSNPKIIFVVMLVLILGFGMFLLFKTPAGNNTGKNVDNKGLLSFFGERKTKPNDETTVPGVNDGGVKNPNDFLDLNGNGINDKDESNTGSDNTNGNGQGDNNQDNNGSLSIKNIGTNGSNVNGNTTGSGTGNGGGTGSGSGTGTGSGTGGGQEEPAVQVDCTPKKLVFTPAQQKRLDALNKRFYELAAELKTEQDVENLQRTKENYINFISSDYSANSPKDGSGIVELTKKCFDERNSSASATANKKTTDPLYGKPIGLRPNPFITSNNLSEILATNSQFRAILFREKRSIENNLTTIKTQISALNKEIAILENNLVKLKEDYLKAIKSTPVDFAKEAAAEQSILNTNDSLDYLRSDLQRKNEEKSKSEAMINQMNTDPLSHFANSTSYVDPKDEKINGVPQKRFTDAKQKSNVYQRVQSMFFNSFYCNKDSTWIKTGPSITAPEGSENVWTFDQGDTVPKDDLKRRFTKDGNIRTEDYDWGASRNNWKRVESPNNVLYYLEEPDCDKGYDNGIVRYFWGYGDWARAKSNPLKDAGYANTYCGPDADKLSDDADSSCSQEYYPMQEIERLLGIW